MTNDTNKTVRVTMSHRNAHTVTPTIALITLDPPDLLRFWIATERHVTVFVLRDGLRAFGDACLYVPAVHSDVTVVSLVETFVLDDGLHSH